MDAPAQVHDGPEEACMKNTAPAPTPSTTMDIVGMVIFLVLSIAAAWYGWKLGNQWAPGFWTKIQNYGLSLGKMFGNKPAPTIGQRIGNVFRGKPTV